MTEQARAQAHLNGSISSTGAPAQLFANLRRSLEALGHFRRLTLAGAEVWESTPVLERFETQMTPRLRHVDCSRSILRRFLILEFDFEATALLAKTQMHQFAFGPAA